MARTPDQTATLYAAYKTLERMVKDEPLPPGYYKDLSGTTITITLPPETVVARDKGTNGDGTIFKTATQNLYGWGVITLLAMRLNQFNQWASIRQVIVDVVKQALKKDKSTEAELLKIDPDLARQIQTIKETTAIQVRTEPTPRICKDTAIPATVTIQNPK